MRLCILMVRILCLIGCLFSPVPASAVRLFEAPPKDSEANTPKFLATPIPVAQALGLIPPSVKAGIRAAKLEDRFDVIKERHLTGNVLRTNHLVFEKQSSLVFDAADPQGGAPLPLFLVIVAKEITVQDGQITNLVTVRRASPLTADQGNVGQLGSPNHDPGVDGRGASGGNGGDGSEGAEGSAGVDLPPVFIFTEKVTTINEKPGSAALRFDLRGNKGGTGGQGGPGGDGGSGAKGHASRTRWYPLPFGGAIPRCTTAAGEGGYNGVNGIGGKGGRAGAGGEGAGVFIFMAPGTENSFGKVEVINLGGEAGTPGHPGIPGRPGSPGQGGAPSDGCSGGREGPRKTNPLSNHGMGDSNARGQDGLTFEYSTDVNDLINQIVQ